MIEEFDPKAGDAALARAQGTELFPGVQQFLEAQTDWFTYCQVCGKRREGTIAQLTGPCSHD